MREHTEFHEKVLQFKSKYLDEDCLLTKQVLILENSLYWFSLCKFCKEYNIMQLYQGISSETNSDLVEAKSHSDLDLFCQITPKVQDFCPYLSGYV